MLARHAVLLTSLESAHPDCLPTCKQIAPATPLESALTSYPQLTEKSATLSLAESALTRIPRATSLESALTKTPGVGVGVQLSSSHHEPIFTRPNTQVLSFHTITHSFARTKNSTLLFSSDSTLFQKSTGGGYPSRVLRASRSGEGAIVTRCMRITDALQRIRLSDRLPVPRTCIRGTIGADVSLQQTAYGSQFLRFHCVGGCDG
jgi:hypothetical protein